jgi:pilus assembly protein CpaE
MTMQDYQAASGPVQDHVAPLPRIAIQAFCETTAVMQVIQATQSDRRMSKTMLRVQDGGIAACLEAYRSAPTPNVIIIEASGDRNGLLVSLDELAQYCDSGTRVLVIGHTNDVLLYRELIKRGVSEYLIAPLTLMDVIGALSAMFNSGEGEKLGRVIGVVGSKGGVGASTIAHNLAFMTATDFEIATTLVDLDLPFGTAGLDFNQDPPQGVAEAVLSPDRLDANFVDRLLSKCTDKLSLMAAPATLDRTYDFQETDFDALLDLLRSSMPMIVLDVPHMWNAWTRRMLTSADHVIIVCSPDLANLRNAKTLLDVVKQARPNDAPPGIIMNMTGVPKRPEISVAEFIKALDGELYASIPFDPALFGTAANNGQMLVEVQPKSKAVEALQGVSRRVTGRAETKIQKKSILDPLLSKLKIKAA